MGRKKGLPTGMSKRKNGQIMFQLTESGKRLTVYGKSERECREKMDAKRAALKEKTYVSGKGITCEKYFDRWIDS